MSTKYPEDERTIRLKSRFNPDKISEGADSIKYTSYTLNKGEKVVFCLRSRNNYNELHKKNTLMFVAIHELAHIMSITKGHNEEFNINFKYLLENAVDIGIYDPKNYNESPQEYCGIPITDTPLSEKYFN